MYAQAEELGMPILIHPVGHFSEQSKLEKRIKEYQSEVEPQVKRLTEALAEETNRRKEGRSEFESVPFDPKFADKPGGYQKVTLTRKLRSQDDGAREIEMGIAMAVMVDRKTPGAFTVPAGRRAFLRVDDVEIDFVPRSRNDDVTE